MPTGESDNGRVTLALVKQAQDATNQLLREFIAEQRRMNDSFSERLLQDELDAKGRETRLKAVEENEDKQETRLKALETSDRKFGIIGVVAGAIAGILTGWFKP